MDAMKMCPDVAMVTTTSSHN